MKESELARKLTGVIKAIDKLVSEVKKDIEKVKGDTEKVIEKVEELKRLKNNGKDEKSL